MSVNSLTLPGMNPRLILVVRILSAHVLGLALAIPILWLANLASLGAGFGLLAICQGLAAAWFGWRFGLPVWWQWINLLFLPMVWLAAQADLNSDWYLLGLIGLAVTSIGALTNRVPLYLSSDRAASEVARLVPSGAGHRLIDLGCGLGGLLAGVRRARPDVALHGVDAAPLPWLFSRARLTGRADIRFGSLWAENLGGYDVVYAYLSPEPMARLWSKVRAEMRPGSLFISNTFSVPDIGPDETIELNDLSRARLLVWRIR
jgi:hypothetical protein